jgi:hypothetical protein
MPSGAGTASRRSNELPRAGDCGVLTKRAPALAVPKHTVHWWQALFRSHHSPGKYQSMDEMFFEVLRRFSFLRL